MPLARKIFFYIFALIYVIFCPLIVLYSLGYVFKPNIEQHVVETGTIYLATMPPGASVRLNDRPRPGTTPIALDELMPGNYRVEVSMEGYKPWTANLAVMAGAATVQRRILLVSKNWNPELLLTEKIEKLIPIPEAPFFLIAKGELLSDYAAYDWKKKTFTPLLKTDLTYAGYRVLRCFTERDSHFFICEIVSENRMGYLWFDVNGLDIIVRDISNKVYGKPYQIAWDPDDGDNIFIFYSDTVNRLETSSGKVYDNYLKGIRGWGMKNKDIYVLTDDAKFISMDYEKKNIRIVLDDPELFTSLFGASGRYSIL